MTYVLTVSSLQSNLSLDQHYISTLFHMAPTASLGTQQPTEFWEDVHHSKRAGEKTDFPNEMVYILSLFSIL